MADLSLPTRKTGDKFRFGLNATNQYTTWQEYKTLCLESEAMGFDSFWVFDHFVPGPASPEGACLECFTTISALASITSRIQLGTLVLGVTYRNPALVAKMAGMVDVVSGGRSILGMGAGWYKLEHEMYGIPFPPPAERVRREDEALTIIRTMWTEQTATFKGRYYDIEGAMMDPKPVQQPYPPILVGARGQQLAFKVVAKHADMWNTSAGPDDIREMNRALDLRCVEIGRDPATLERTAIVLQSISSTPEREKAKQDFLSSLFRQPFENLENRVLTGSPEHVVEQLQAYVDAGVTHFMFSCMAPYDLEGLKVMADKVLPKFR